ncbi:N-formylglutamate deformylase [Azospirillum sp. sgz302134]
MNTDWLAVRRGSAPLILSMPHGGIDIPDAVAERLADPWLARKDADWWIDRLYDFAEELDATIVRTTVSRTVIDVNRDPSGASLYPGQATTDLCPLTSFDGEPLYKPGQEPDAAEIAERRARWFAPYHAALTAEIARLRAAHPRVVVYDCHSIRSVVPRLFEGRLPVFNIGTNGGRSCDPALQEAVAAMAAASGRSWVVNGRFKGGSITRLHARPQDGVHSLQMELSTRAYLAEPEGPVGPENWPVLYDPAHAAPVRRTLRAVLDACLSFARTPA